MKKISAYILFSLLSAIGLAQVPQGINYQAVARTSGGTAIANGTIAVKFEIFDGDPSTTGFLICTDDHTSVPTNQFGLFTLVIGGGALTPANSFATIPWATGNKWLRVSIDPANGNNFVTIGSSQFMSVPFALYAASSSGGATGAT